ncbi:hypothetical protein [Lactiplantibacillus songbeiensis]|uniref:S-layer protein n=1 Tax=Lactiplantibacillus songbeiensis TaxID=2559920 RepID=A0ABW4C3K1_9LACO|nr:hypothetical protein [Lactiplantibacillus songbeiensis]
MQSTLAKSVFVGLAALSFASVAQLNANAATKSATTKSNVTLTTDATTRNVVPTGSNAIYSYPKTVKKSARTVASKATVAKLASSKSSKDYFRAYRVLTTSKGSVYYKVVSFDGAVRGYIYGGKSTSAFAGGLKAASTTTASNLTADEQTKTYFFANPGSKNVTWNNPQYTQYKASKMVKSTADFGGDNLQITKAVTKTREGSRYVYVNDKDTPSLSGWVYAKALSTTKAVTYNDKTDVKVNYIDAATSKIVKSGFVKVADKSTATGTNVAINDALYTAIGNGKPDNYAYSSKDNNNVLTSVKTGDTVTAYVYATASSKLALYAAPESSSNTIGAGSSVPGTSVSYTKLTAENVNFPTLKDEDYAVLTGRTTDKLTGTTVKTFAAAHLSELKGTKQVVKTVNGKPVKGYYVYKLDTTANFGDVAFGTTYNVPYTTTFVEGDLSTTTNTGNTNYVD